MMTREEIIKEYETAVAALAVAVAAGIKGAKKSYELFKAGLNALRPVSREQELEAENMELKERIINWRKYMAPTREQVEQVWKGEWLHDPETGYECCEKCRHTICLNDYLNGNPPPFCEFCGAPMTDEAVEMAMEKINEMEGTENGLD